MTCTDCILRFGFAAMLLALSALWGLAAVAAEPPYQLLMFERDGCPYCRQWNEEIGPAYPKTAEGQAAPLQRLDIYDPLPDGVTLTGRKPTFTPTFVLISDGTEVGRIEGYAGNEFFWVMLDNMLSKAGWSPPPQAGVAADASAASSAPALAAP